MKLSNWLFLLPAAVGAVAALVLAQLGPLDPILFAGADIATWLLLAGIGVSLLVGAVTMVARRSGTANRKRMAELEARAADERRRFLQRLDHELKNPLTAIRAGLANLTDAPLDDIQRDALLSVESQTLRLSTLLSDLRKLAELETRPIDRVPIDLADLLREVVNLAEEQPEAKQRHVALSVPQVPWPLPAILGDRDLLFLAVHNLLNNALKFTRPGDSIEVRALEDGSSVVVEVADSGPGIPEGELPHVWEELFRGKGVRGVPGSGLGLALTRAIAERHGGQVSIRSRPGQGTVFSLRLPLEA